MTPFTSLIAAWGLNAFWPIVAKGGTRLFSGILFAHAGCVIGLIFLAPWIAQQGRWRRIVSPELRERLFWIAACGAAGTTLYVVALEFTTPANAAILAQVEVLYSAGLCLWLLKEHIPMGQIAGSLLVLAGTWLIVAHDLNSIRWKGDLMILATPWMFQVAHIRAKRLPADLDPILLAGSRLFYGSIALIPASLWALRHHPQWNWTGTGLAILLAQGIGMSALSYLTWYRAIRGMDLAKATTILLSYPALTMLLSWGLGSETLHPVQIAGLILTLSGAYWVSRLVMASRRTPPSAPISSELTNVSP